MATSIDANRGEGIFGVVRAATMTSLLQNHHGSDLELMFSQEQLGNEERLGEWQKLQVKNNGQYL